MKFQKDDKVVFARKNGRSVYHKEGKICICYGKKQPPFLPDADYDKNSNYYEVRAGDLAYVFKEKDLEFGDIDLDPCRNIGEISRSYVAEIPTIETGSILMFDRSLFLLKEKVRVAGQEEVLGTATYYKTRVAGFRFNGVNHKFELTNEREEITDD